MRVLCAPSCVYVVVGEKSMCVGGGASSIHQLCAVEGEGVDEGGEGRGEMYSSAAVFGATDTTAATW